LELLTMRCMRHSKPSDEIGATSESRAEHEENFLASCMRSQKGSKSLWWLRGLDSVDGWR
jgi:hypothetical protein